MLWSGLSQHPIYMLFAISYEKINSEMKMRENNFSLNGNTLVVMLSLSKMGIPCNGESDPGALTQIKF